MSKTKVIKFPNGATLLYKKRHSHNYCAVNIGFGSGYMQNDKNGVAHFLEHILFKQTTTRTEKQINELRDKLCFLNAYTSPNSIFVVFSRTNRLIEKSFEFATDVLLNTKFSNKYIEEEKQVIIEERRIENASIDKDVSYQHQFTLSTNPRSKDKSLGSFEDIGSITKEDLQRYRDENFVAKNFICSIVGKISLHKVKSLLKKYVFPYLKCDENFIPSHDWFDIDKEPSMRVYKNSLEKTSVLISYKIDDTSTNTMYNYNYHAITRYLNNSEKSMYTILRKKGLIYSASSYVGFSEKCGYLNILVQTGKEKVIDCIKVISSSIQGILSGAISDEDIKVTQDNYFYHKDETTGLSYQKIANNLADDYAIKKDYIKVKQKLCDKAMKNLSKEGVLRTANEIFVEKNPYITFMGNIEENDIDFKKVLKLLKFKRSENE